MPGPFDAACLLGWNGCGFGEPVFWFWEVSIIFLGTTRTFLFSREFDR